MRLSQLWVLWGGVITSCSNGSDDESTERTITFHVTENSTNEEETVLSFSYNRSGVGAEELVTIEDCGIVVKLNGEEIKTIDTLEFELNEWGASFDNNDKDPISDTKNMQEYHMTVSLGKKVEKDNTVVLYYNKGVGTITGEGKDAEAIKGLTVALIDTSEEAKYWTELADGEEKYQPLF